VRHVLGRLDARLRLFRRRDSPSIDGVKDWLPDSPVRQPRQYQMQFQFTLRSMLVAVLLLSWPIARISNEFRKERLRAEAQQVAMSKLNGLTPKGVSMSVRDATFVLPAPLRQLIGSWCIDDQRVLVTMFPVTEIDLSTAIPGWSKIALTPWGKSS